MTGPNVVKTVTHENVTSEELGGAMTHATKSGVTHFTAANGLEAIQMLKRLLSYIPQNCEEEPPSVPYEAGDESRPGLNDLIPENPNQPYDMRDVITQVIDTDSFFEVHKDFAENIVVGFARLAGKSIGIVANQPAQLAGVLDIHASTKAARLSGSAIASIFRCSYSKTFRDSFREPTRVERDHHQRCETALCVQRSDRSAHHGDHPESLWRSVRCDEFQTHWRRHELRLAERGDRGDGRQGRRRNYLPQEITEAKDPEAKLKEKEQEYNELFANPYKAAEHGYVDEVIRPDQTRSKLISAFRMLETKAVKLPKEGE